MAVNKVIYGGNTLIDLTGDTATEDEAFEGVTFHGADGEVKTGTFTVAEEITEQDSLIAQIQSALAGKAAGGGTDGRFDALLDGSITKIDSNVTEVSKYKCYEMTSLTSVNLPECTTIGNRVFYECNKITSINLPECTIIGSDAFSGCGKITSFNAPKVTAFGSRCFSYNRGVTEYNFPLAETVPGYAFSSCSALVKADFGVAKSIDAYGFMQCSKLEALILRKSDAIATLTSSSFAYSGIAEGIGYIYVPAALIEEYKVADNWSTYAGRFRAIEDYPDVCGGMA